MDQQTRLSPAHLTRLQRSLLETDFLKPHKANIEKRLRALGADSYDLLLPETHKLPLIINLDEEITGIVYGRYKMTNGTVIGRGALVTTDERILLVDKKPLFLKCEEISYYVVSGVTYGKAGPAATVVLHTRLGDISVRTFNQKCAANFVKAIEARIYNNDTGNPNDSAT